MKFIKSLFLASVVIASTITAQAQAPTYGPNDPAWTIGTNTLAPSAATNLWLVVDCRKQASVAFRLSASSIAATNEVVQFNFVRSLTGLTNSWETTTSTTVNVTSSTTSIPVVITNIPTYGAGYIAVLYASNTLANCTATNVTIGWSAKISSP